MVSIVITAYNVGEWIEQSVFSALGQTQKNIEVIVIDDCSTDNTASVLEKIKDSRLKVIHNRKNRGAGLSRRAGIKAAKGDYILLLDGDDWLEKEYIATLHQTAKESNADIVSGGITIVESDGSTRCIQHGDCIVEGKEKFSLLAGNNVVYLNNKLIKRRLHKLVPYCKRRFIEDTPVVIPLLYFAGSVAYNSNCGYNYRMRASSLTHRADDFKYALFRALCIEDIVSFFEKQDEEYLTFLPLAQCYSQCIAEIKRCNPSKKDIACYRHEWYEFTTGLIRRMA
ncbi:MAG: glycosyltransferase family 2 protein [Bacteroidales bacterium]|nr:glycosyltransferase family 2 protein [Bacteroidales bacterium]